MIKVIFIVVLYVGLVWVVDKLTDGRIPFLKFPENDISFRDNIYNLFLGVFLFLIVLICKVFARFWSKSLDNSLEI